MNILKRQLSTCSFFALFASEAWENINLIVNPDLQPLQNLEILRAHINQDFFMEIIILFCWAIWMSRNNFIFSELPPSIQGCKRIFKSKFLWLLYMQSKDSPKFKNG